MDNMKTGFVIIIIKPLTVQFILVHIKKKNIKNIPSLVFEP